MSSLNEIAERVASSSEVHNLICHYVMGSISARELIQDIDKLRAFCETQRIRIEDDYDNHPGTEDFS